MHPGFLGMNVGLHDHLRNSRTQGHGLIALKRLGAIGTKGVLHRMDANTAQGYRTAIQG